MNNIQEAILYITSLSEYLFVFKTRIKCKIFPEYYTLEVNGVNRSAVEAITRV
jgi:hypothetical protein